VVDIGAQVRALVDTLTAAGLRATADSRNLNLPAVFVKMPTVDFRFKAGTEQASWAIYVLVPDNGTLAAADALGPLLTATVDALQGQPTTGRPIDFTTEDGVTVPGYELTFTTRTR
jgi:hypothetical protein